MNDQDPTVETPVLDESAEELYEMAPCGYLTTTIDGRIVKVNRTLTEWLGYEPGDLTGGLRLAQLLTAGRECHSARRLLGLRFKQLMNTQLRVGGLRIVPLNH